LSNLRRYGCGCSKRNRLRLLNAPNRQSLWGPKTAMVFSSSWRRRVWHAANQLVVAPFRRTCYSTRVEAWMWAAKEWQTTKYLRLRGPVALGSRFNEWQVCWLGGWAKHRMFYLVMVVRVKT
jgi:hypothetical protein